MQYYDEAKECVENASRYDQTPGSVISNKNKKTETGSETP
jgi:hypothetical protein